MPCLSFGSFGLEWERFHSEGGGGAQAIVGPGALEVAFGEGGGGRRGGLADAAGQGARLLVNFF